MKIFDAHCDTAEKLLNNKVSLYKNECHLDIERMKMYENFSQFFAVCICSSNAEQGEESLFGRYINDEPFQRANTIINALLKEIDINSQHISLCKSYNDMAQAWKAHKIGAFLTLEGASPLCGKLSNLDYFYQKGIRLITLTWNYRNELGCGAVSSQQYPENERGLTPFGIDVVKHMNELGIIIDVSHLSDEGFYDVLKYSSKPFMASHSNSRSICSHVRNLTDDMIRCIGDIGGFIGINLCPEFITDSLNSADANIDKLILHIEHIASIAGENSIGLGCDFDGIDNTPVGINSIADIYKLTNRMIQLNYSSDFIEKFTHKNLCEFLLLLLPS